MSHKYERINKGGIGQWGRMKKAPSCVIHVQLQELDLWGGDFYADGLFPIFTQIGPQLTKLNLVRAFNIMNAKTITTSS